MKMVLGYLSAVALLLGGCVATPRTPVAMAAVPAATAAVETRDPVTVLISIDGFRPDYRDRGVTPHLDALARAGASAAMRPAFPSKTFPNHWAMVTGAYPDHSGITANRMEDPARPGDVFTMASDDPFWWNGLPPIWVDAERQGVRTATMFWPGSNVAWGGNRAKVWPNDVSGGTRPGDWQQFNQAVSGEQRVNAVLDWMRRPAHIRPSLVTLYFDTVDTAGHLFGPDDARTTAAVADVDASIGMLVAGLAALHQPANIVVVADHGMAATDPARVIKLDSLAPPGSYRMVEDGPFVSLVPTEGHERTLSDALSKPHDHVTCWPREAIPARFHYGTNPRVPPWFCLAEPGWLVLADPRPDAGVGGTHGYDNTAPDMAALFIAAGPNIRRAPIAGGFVDFEIYPLVARLAGVRPHASDATGSIADLIVAK